MAHPRVIEENHRFRLTVLRFARHAPLPVYGLTPVICILIEVRNEELLKLVINCSPDCALPNLRPPQRRRGILKTPFWRCENLTRARSRPIDRQRNDPLPSTRREKGNNSGEQLHGFFLDKNGNHEQFNAPETVAICSTISFPGSSRQSCSRTVWQQTSLTPSGAAHPTSAAECCDDVPCLEKTISCIELPNRLRLSGQSSNRAACVHLVMVGRHRRLSHE